MNQNTTIKANYLLDNRSTGISTSGELVANDSSDIKLEIAESSTLGYAIPNLNNSDTDVKLIFCEVCGNKYKTSSSLKRHKLFHPLKCTLCSRGFKKFPKLVFHMSKIHNINDTCEKYAMPRQMMTNLWRKKESKNSESADLLPNDDKTSNEFMVLRPKLPKKLNKPKKIVRNHSGKKPYKCDYANCEKAFFQRADLKSHFFTHTGIKNFKCNVCGKSFSFSGTLKIHQRIHTGLKPFECDICHKSFTVKCTLVTHMRVHSIEKPFICGVCNKTFSAKSSLNYHMKLHTDGKSV